MDCVTQASPSTSVTPPISPLKFVQPSSSSNLPPLKNLPTWNRTSLERTKHARSLTKDAVEIKQSHITEGSACRSTQTSPAVSSVRSPSTTILVSKMSTGGQQSAIKTLERKLAFVQNQYEDVLARLREEVGVLKRENMELTFQLVMKNGNIPTHPELTDMSTSPIFLEMPKETKAVAVETIPASDSVTEEELKEREANEMRIILMDKELRSLRQALREAKDQNTYLVGLVEKQKQRQRIGTKSAKQILETHRNHPPGNIGHQPPERLLPHRKPNTLPPVDTKALEEASSKDRRNSDNNSNDDTPLCLHPETRSEVVDRLIVDNDRGFYEQKAPHRPLPAYEISEIRSGRYRGHLIAPFKHDLPVKKPMVPLPQLSVRAPARPIKDDDTYKSSGINLPAVRPPVGSLAERQRRAHALHVQRQKNNREFTLFKLM